MESIKILEKKLELCCIDIGMQYFAKATNKVDDTVKTISESIEVYEILHVGDSQDIKNIFSVLSYT